MNYKQFLLTSSIALGLSAGDPVVAAEEPASRSDAQNSASTGSNANSTSETAPAAELQDQPS